MPKSGELDDFFIRRAVQGSGREAQLAIGESRAVLNTVQRDADNYLGNGHFVAPSR